MTIGKLTIAEIQSLSHPDVPVLELKDLIVSLESNFDRLKFSRLARAHFLAQVSHESGGFFYLREIGSDAYFAENYEGRSDLGNINPGDGALFCGRGYIQLTGRSNYESYALYCEDKTIVSNPSQLGEVKHAIGAAFFFWERERLSAIADLDDAIELTHRINGGENGLEDRLDLLKMSKEIYDLP
jgi:putative chitinase